MSEEAEKEKLVFLTSWTKCSNTKKHSKDESPIEFSDFALIEIIVQYYDSVRYSGKNKQGLDIIVYEKVLGDKFFVAEEVRTKRGKLAFKSIYKVKLKKQRKS